MYGWIFRNLPGPVWLRVIESLILIAAVVLLLMMYVFPVVNEYISPFTDSTIGEPSQ